MQGKNHSTESPVGLNSILVENQTIVLTFALCTDTKNIFKEYCLYNETMYTSNNIACAVLNRYADV